MYLNYFTTQDKLDTVLRDGITMSDKSTGVARKPNPIWLTEHTNPSTPTLTDREFIAKLQPDSTRWPPNYSVSEPDTNFEGAVRVKVRVRSEQMKPWLWWAIDSYETAYINRFAIREFVDGWFVMEQTITPNQIIRVDRWSMHSDEWIRVELSRRLVLPAVAQRMFPHRGNNVRRHVSPVPTSAVGARVSHGGYHHG